MLDVASILGPGGRIAARLPHYEHRPQQVAMAEAVERSLGGGRHLIVEAGTGVGKSFAYLVPAIQYVTAEPAPVADDEEEEEGLPLGATPTKPRRRVMQKCRWCRNAGGASSCGRSVGRRRVR